MDILNKKILVVEDDTTIRNNIVEFLALQDIEVAAAKNGLEALEVFEAFRPDMIICDIMMPELDGFGFLKELNRKFPIHQSIFIFLTAKNNHSDIRHGMNLGADDYIIKPFLLDDLWETIKIKFEKDQLRKQGMQAALDEISIKTSPTPYHEFNTCLNGIMTGAQILLNADDNSLSLESKTILDIIQHSGFRLYKAINNLILCNEIDANKLNPYIEDVPCSFIESTLSQIASNYDRSKDLSLLLNGDDILKTDKFLIKKIVEEISDNAFKFSKPGDKVMCFVKSQGGGFEMSIHYPCKDFDEHKFAQVQPFNQFTEKLNTISGLGLGLFITKKLSQILGGTAAFKMGEENVGEFHFIFKAN